MRVKIQCPNAECGKSLVVDDDMAGKKGKCSTCGSVFTIPAKGAASASKATVGGAKSKPTASPNKPVRRAAAEEEILDAEEILEDEPPRKKPAASAGMVGSKPRPKLPPRKAPARAAEDEYEDYEDYDDFGGGDADDDEAEYAPQHRSKASVSTKQRWARVRTGMLIVAISACTLSGAFALKMISELLFDLAVGNVLSLVSFAEDAKAESEELQKELRGMSGAERMSRTNEIMAKMREKAERAQKKVQSSQSMANAGATTFKVAQIAYLVAGLGIVGGCVFWVFAPKTKGTAGLGIATLVVGAIGCVLLIIFEIVPLFSGPADRSGAPEWVREMRQRIDRGSADAGGADAVVLLYKKGQEGAVERMSGAAGGRIPVPSSVRSGAEAETSDKVLALLIDVLFAAQWILLGLFLSAAAKATKNRQHAANCLRIVWMVAAWGGVMLLFYLFVFIDWDSSGSAWSVYVTWLIHWIANALLGTGLFFAISNLFYSRRATR